MFTKFIQKYGLIDKKDKILLAFSGGPDSVYMLEQFLNIKDEYELTLHLAYVNHNLREDVYKDISFVKKIANKYNIELKSLQFIINSNNKQPSLFLAKFIKNGNKFLKILPIKSIN